MATTLIMGTRGSPLALAQSRQVAGLLRAAHSGLHIEERIIRTSGDRQQGQPLPTIGGKGLFTLELEQALLDGNIDFAVHSLKDLPPERPAGLAVVAVPRRGPAQDACLTSPGLGNSGVATATVWPQLPVGARVGTSSLRRQAQLLALRPDLKVVDIRGNIDTRISKLVGGHYDAIVLAAAGLERLGASWPGGRFDFDQHQFVPAPGQGALAIEARRDDSNVRKLLGVLEDCSTRAEITAEREAMRALGAGCSTPLGTRGEVQGDTLHLWATVLAVDGSRRVDAAATGVPADAAALAEEVARQLLSAGAAELLS